MPNAKTLDPRSEPVLDVCNRGSRMTGEKGRFLALLGTAVVRSSLTAISLKHRMGGIKGGLVRERFFFCPDASPWSDEHEDRL